MTEFQEKIKKYHELSAVFILIGRNCIFFSIQNVYVNNSFTKIVYCGIKSKKTVPNFIIWEQFFRLN